MNAPADASTFATTSPKINSIVIDPISDLIVCAASPRTVAFSTA